MDRIYEENLVSVIIPIFNAEKFLRQTLNSVFEQDYEQIELILVDDCSNDRSAKIISEIMKSHSEVSYFLQRKNMGAGAARNKALEIAKGRYIAFLDSDDEWMKEKTRKQIELMRKSQIPFSYTAIEMIDEKGNIRKTKRKLKTSCNYKYLLRNTIIATSSVIIDRKLIGEFYMPLRRGGQDYATWLMLLRDGHEACGINEPLVKYRVSKNSLSSNKLKSIKQVWEIQTKNEGISKIKAFFNVLFFSVNAFKKYFF